MMFSKFLTFSMLWEKFWHRRLPKTAWFMTASFVNQNSSKVQSKPHFQPREMSPCQKSETMSEIMESLLEFQNLVQKSVDRRITKTGNCVKPWRTLAYKEIILRIGPLGKLGHFDPTAEIFLFTLLQSA
jgi:hypothetical protein